MRLRYVLAGLLCLAGSRTEKPEADRTDTISVLDISRFSLPQEQKFVLYDTNRGEGFNLRRDVHMRVAIGVKKLRARGVNAVLVLPPWGGLYHWKDRESGIPWSELFDVPSLNRFVPSIEFHEFVRISPVIDRVIYLQHFQEGWEGEYLSKHEKRPCLEGYRYYAQEEKQEGDAGEPMWRGWFFANDEVRARHFDCISFQGDSNTIADLLARNYSGFTSLMLDRAETALHADYGGREYWRARRSMRYNRALERRAEQFIEEELQVEIDAPPLTERWEEEQMHRRSRGGAYVCAHWRRADFVHAYGSSLPSIAGAARQIQQLAHDYNVTKVFLATDADEKEIQELTKKIGAKVHIFRTGPQEPKLIDGAAAVVEQIICSWARAFTGSHQSTFSYRIQEDREIRGFPVLTTFRRMCADDVTKHECDQPSKWQITY